MSKVNNLKELLDGNFFKYKGKQYAFQSCKLVSYRMMILTDSETLQIDEVALDSFIEEISPTVTEFGTQIKSFASEKLPMRNLNIMIPETPSIFKKINESFDTLLSEIEGADDEKLKTLEIKSKMLTSVAQSAINMENSRVKLIEVINR